jgi:hypothetical protein
MHNIEIHPTVGLSIEPQTCLGYFSEFEGSGAHEFSVSELCCGVVQRQSLGHQVLSPCFGLDSGFGIYFWIKLHVNVLWHFRP